jgi:hypothetical protein
MRAANDVIARLLQLLAERDRQLAELKRGFDEQVSELRDEMARTRAAMNRLVAFDRAARQERDTRLLLH